MPGLPSCSPAAAGDLTLCAPHHGEPSRGDLSEPGLVTALLLPIADQIIDESRPEIPRDIILSS